jgi:hypothetical protein
MFYKHGPEVVTSGGFVGRPAVAAGGAPEAGVAAEPATEAAVAPWAPSMDGKHGPGLGAWFDFITDCGLDAQPVQPLAGDWTSWRRNWREPASC